MTPAEIAALNTQDIARLNRLALWEAQEDPLPDFVRGIIRFLPTPADVRELLDEKEWEQHRMHRHL